MHNEHMFPTWLKAFIEIYSSLGVDNTHRITEIYSEDVLFEDPAHELRGISQLTDYFDSLYTNLDECNFVIEDVFYSGSQAAIYWTMTYRHRKLNGNRPVKVEGHSHLQGHSNQVTHHRDYLDLGAMVYENVPLLGGIVKKIKRNLAN